MIAALPVWVATLVISNVNVVTMERASAKARARCVVIEGERIVAVGERDDACVRRGATTIDGKGATLVPGFNDAHVHLGLAMALSKAPPIPRLPRARWIDAVRARAMALPFGAWAVL